MSWITGLADKAENILNKIDKNAATALQLPPGATSAGTVTTDTMRKSLSGSTLSIKSTLSPSKLSQRSAAGVKTKNYSETLNDAPAREKTVTWSVGSDSRRSSVSSKDNSVSIEIDGQQVAENTPNKARDAQVTALHLQSMSTPAMGSLISENQELAAFRIALSEVTNERDELRLRLSSLSRDVENAALKQRTQELELLVERLMEERDQAQHELHDSQSTSDAYVHSISELESSLAKLQQEYMEAAHKLQIQMRETEQQRKELQEYRMKAQRALQMKDQLITELKASGAADRDAEGTSADKNSNETNLHLLQMEFDALKQERQHTLEENNNLTAQLDQARHDLIALSKQHTEQLTVLRANEESLRKDLRVERERALATESEHRVLTQELNSLRQQLSNHMAASATRLQEKEQQLQKMRRLTQENGNEPQNTQHDSRIKTLTQALVDKQNAVENVTAERNALRIQLEKVQDQLRQTTVYNNNLNSSNNSRNSLLSNSTDDVKAQFPLLMRANPFDNRVARRVKRAYSSLDSAGIRLGAFLRRYPLMRIGVLIYVALLHIWVMFVLLSTTPN